MLGILLYLIFLLVTAPAFLLRPVLNQWLPQVQVSSLEGSLWQGSAVPVILQVNQAAVYLGRLDWQLDPWSLLRLQPRLQLQTRADTHQLETTLILDRTGLLTVRDTRFNFPIALLEPWVPLLVSGTIEAELRELTLSQQAVVAADGLVLFRDIFWLAGDNRRLVGDYQAQLQRVDDRTLGVDLADLGAALALTGNVRAGLDGRYQMQLTLLPTPALAPEIRQSLQLFYRPNARGESQLNQSGRWR